MKKCLVGYEGVRVLGARLIIRLEEEKEANSGIILLNDTKEPKYEGVIVATGEGARLDNGVTMPMSVQPGERVIYSRMAGVPITYDGEELLVINERDVIAVIEPTTISLESVDIVQNLNV